MNRLYRSDANKIIAGVCGGIGEYLRIDPLIVRILFVLLAMNGVGLLVYLMLWIFLPVAHAQYQNQDEMMRRNIEEMGAQARKLGQDAQGALRGNWGKQNPNRALIVGLVLVGLGLLILLDNLGWLWWFNVGRLWPLLLIALGASILLNNLKDKR